MRHRQFCLTEIVLSWFTRCRLYDTVDLEGVAFVCCKSQPVNHPLAGKTGAKYWDFSGKYEILCCGTSESNDFL